jgi:hypothetical protein
MSSFYLACVSNCAWLQKERPCDCWRNILRYGSSSDKRTELQVRQVRVCLSTTASTRVLVRL